MASFTFYHRMAIHPCSKSGANPDNKPCILHAGSQIPLGKNGIYHSIRLQPVQEALSLIHNHRYFFLRNSRTYIFQAFCPNRRNAFHTALSQANRLRKSNISTNCCGNRQITVANGYSRTIQPNGNSRCQISCSPDKYKHKTFLSEKQIFWQKRKYHL